MTPPGSATAQPIVQNGVPFLPGDAQKATDPAPQNPPAKGGDSFGGPNPSAPNPAAGQNSLFGKFDPKKINPSASEKLVKEGDKLFKSKNYEKAFQTYLKALEANPKEASIILKLTSTAYKAGDPITAHDTLSAYIEMKPDDLKSRGNRLQLAQLIGQSIAKNFGRLKTDQEKMQAQQLLVGLDMEMKTDGALMLAYDADNQLESLKKMDGELAKLHDAPLEKRQMALAGIQKQIEEMMQARRMPYATPEQTKLVQEKLQLFITESFGLLERFTKADSDEGIKKVAPVFEAYHLLAQGKTQDAMKPLELVRSQGLKDLGKGDEAKGRERLKEINKQAQQLAKDNKMEELGKLVAEVPLGLADADAILGAFETDKLRRENLAAVAIWKNNIQETWNIERDDATGAWSSFWRGALWLGHGKFDEINAKSAAARDLVFAVESRINKGEANTIAEALLILKDKGPAELKTAAADILDHLDRDEIGKMIDYTSQVKPSEKSEQALLSTAFVLKTFSSRDRTAAGLNSLIQFTSENAGRKKDATDRIDTDKVGSDVKDYLAQK